MLKVFVPMFLACIRNQKLLNILNSGHHFTSHRTVFYVFDSFEAFDLKKIFKDYFSPEYSARFEMHNFIPRIHFLMLLRYSDLVRPSRHTLMAKPSCRQLYGRPDEKKVTFKKGRVHVTR